MRRTELEAEAKSLFECAEARISTFSDKHFLIIGYAKTAQWYPSTAEWARPRTYSYIEQHCIASGRTYRELREEMLECHRLSQLGDAELMEHILGLGNGLFATLEAQEASDAAD